MAMLLARNNGFFDPFTDVGPLVRTFLTRDEEVPTWAPATDIFEREDALEIVSDLPGLSLDAISVTVHDGVLTVKAERRQPEHEACCSERPYGTFERSFTLGDGLDTDKIEARYDAGVLSIRVPKRPEVQPRRIEVKQ